MPFTPKFVDLVRNVTSVEGTGPVTLGAAVTGYTSLATAAATGEQFYYCIQGVDKPAEREVGRGTMQADGTIAREAVSGSLTSFTTGAKTIALVAAAEWFSKLDEVSVAAASFGIDTREGMAALDVASVRTAILAERGSEGLFVFDDADQSAEIAADPARGVHVAPASDPTGASGAWVRKYSGSVNVRWFGATGDGVTDDGAAFVAALAYLKSIAENLRNVWYKGSPRLYVPAGHYYLGTTTLDITHTLIVEGEGSGQSGGEATKLRWDADTTGIRVQKQNTSGADTADAVSHFAGDATTIRGLFLFGGYIGTEGEYHGIQLRARATIEDCSIQAFQGSGIHIVATAGGGTGGAEGNANGWAINRATINSCRDGLFVAGADANAGTATLLDVRANRRWGIWETSFLGNTYVACHSAGNGARSGEFTPTLAEFGGNRYGVIAGQEAGASINAPSGTATDNAWWYFLSGGGTNASVNINPWANGTTYRAGGAYLADENSGRNVFIGCYFETGQGVPQMTSPTLVLGGQMNNLRGTASYVRSNASATTMQDLLTTGRITVQGSGSSFGVQSDIIRDNTTYFNTTNNFHSLLFRSWTAGAATTVADVTGRKNFGLILEGNPQIQLRYQPTDAIIGTISQAGFAVAGTLSATGNIGYAAGAGGAVVQATSKATGVTLNKPAGKITLAGDALAAGTSVSFTLTNSAIAPTDVVIVNIGSGASADCYAAVVDQVAAGSCRIQLRNVSAGSLSEAVTINYALLKAVAA